MHSRFCASRKCAKIKARLPDVALKAEDKQVATQGEQREPLAGSTLIQKISNGQFRSDDLLLTIPVALAVWLGTATTFLHFYSSWPWSSAFFYAVDTGLSIGFGALQPKDDVEKCFIILHVLVGAGVFSGALALFADSQLQSGGSDASALLQDVAARLGEDSVKLKESTTTLMRSKPPPLSGILQVFSNASIAEELFIVWILLGTSYGVLAEGYTPISGLYFAITSLATGGLQTPAIADSFSSDVPRFHGWAVGIYCITGVPIFAANLGKVASRVVRKLIYLREKEAIETQLTVEEFNAARSLFDDCYCNDAGDKVSTIDRTEFVILELLRLDKVDPLTIQLMINQYNRLDADKNGRLSYQEIFGDDSPGLARCG
jgi:hypothetical protein